MSGPQDVLATIDSEQLNIHFDNNSDPECTVIRVEGKDRTDLLMSLTGAFTTAGVAVISASILTEDGKVTDMFRVQDMEGNKVGAAAALVGAACMASPAPACCLWLLQQGCRLCRKRPPSR
jgi:hypothetical protein